MATADQIERQRLGITKYNPIPQSDKDARKQWGTSRTTASQLGLAPTSGGKTVEQMVQERLAGVQFPDINSLFGNLGTSASSGPKASDILAQRKFEYEMAKDKADAERAARSLAAYQNMLSGGGYRAGYDELMNLVTAQGEKSKTAAEDIYKRALENIAAGYSTAEDLTKKGYEGLQSYLQQNQNNPYANVQVSAGTAPDAMEQLLSAYGVSADPVRAQVAAEQAAAQQGAAGFQNLLSTLSGVAQQSDLSRLAELEMARTLAGQTLGTQRATYSSQAEQARANALAQIEAQLAQARLEQEAAALARRQSIEDAIIAAGGSVSGGSESSSSGSGGAQGGGGGESEDERRRRELLAQMVANAAAGAGTGANLGQMFSYAI